MKFAYADPPYIGQAKKHYSHDPRCAEVDHKLLIERLCDEYTAGWTLSLSAPSLSEALPTAPKEHRVLSWVKPFCAFKRNVTLAYAWEPVILWRGRKRPVTMPTVRDWIAENITLKRGISGAKPERFCMWMFNCLGMNDEDEFDDLFPGSGAVAQAWEKFVMLGGSNEIGGNRK